MIPKTNNNLLKRNRVTVYFDKHSSFERFYVFLSDDKVNMYRTYFLLKIHDSLVKNLQIRMTDFYLVSKS